MYPQIGQPKGFALPAGGRGDCNVIVTGLPLSLLDEFEIRSTFAHYSIILKLSTPILDRIPSSSDVGTTFRLSLSVSLSQLQVLCVLSCSAS